MPKGSNDANATVHQAQKNSNTLTDNSNGIYSALIPQLETEAVHPAGFSPTDLASMNTHAMETAGGATAGATGRGALLAGRTRNAGTPAAAIADAARSGTQALATTGQSIDAQNAELKAKEQQAGLAGLQGLYGTDIAGAGADLSEVAPLVNANTNAEGARTDQAQDWFKDAFTVAQAGAKAAGAKV